MYIILLHSKYNDEIKTTLAKESFTTYLKAVEMIKRFLLNDEKELNKNIEKQKEYKQSKNLFYTKKYKNIFCFEIVKINSCL